MNRAKGEIATATSILLPPSYYIAESIQHPKPAQNLLADFVSYNAMIGWIG